MEEKITGKTRNLIFFSIVVVSILGLVAAIVMGNKEEQVYKENSQRYGLAEKLMKEGNYQQAEQQFAELLEVYPGSHKLYWNYALSLAAQNKFRESEKYFVEARKERPFLVRNQLFVVQYGEVLYRQQKYAEAKTYLEEGQKINMNPQLSSKVEALLKEIKQKEVRGK